MDAALNRKSLTFGIPGIILQIVGNVVVRLQDPAAPNLLITLAGVAIALTGTGLLIYGLSFYARAKGHSGWLGLLGLLSCLGLIILAAMPDRLKDATPKSWVR